MGADRLAAYWCENISYDLGDRHLEGLTLFYHYCAELELLAAEPDLHFLAGFQQKEL
jgi:predicted solute-binding protein